MVAACAPTRKVVVSAVTDTSSSTRQPVSTTAPSASTTSLAPAAATAAATATQDSEVQAIRAAFLGWLDTKPRDAVGAYVEDFVHIRSAIVDAAAKAPLPPDAYSGRIDTAQLTDPTHAKVVYDFLNGGQVVVAGQTGIAVKLDGTWKVSRATVCAALAIGGTQCPPLS
jgi:hypothetical protein